MNAESKLFMLEISLSATFADSDKVADFIKKLNENITFVVCPTQDSNNERTNDKGERYFSQLNQSTKAFVSIKNNTRPDVLSFICTSIARSEFVSKVKLKSVPSHFPR